MRLGPAEGRLRHVVRPKNWFDSPISQPFRFRFEVHLIPTLSSPAFTSPLARFLTKISRCKPMSARIPFQRPMLLTAAVILGVALVWTEYAAGRQIRTLRAQVTQAQLDTLADDRAGLEQFVAGINAALTRAERFQRLSRWGLLAGGVAVLILIYRRRISPPPADVTASRALIERQEKLASLGVFATGIAHEIRNPLTAIKLRVFSLKTSLRPDTSEYEDLEVIENEIDDLERIVRDFLQFARPAEPDLQPISVAKLLRDTAGLLTTDLAKRAITLHLDLGTEAVVQADAARMKQVLINIVQNAAESIENGGTITLRARLDQQPLQDRLRPAVVLDIADTGKGIPPAVQKRLFDPFFTTKETGAGLGLCIAARIVEKHHGVIHYQTELQRGTTFSIVLPRAATNENET